MSAATSAAKKKKASAPPFMERVGVNYLRSLSGAPKDAGETKPRPDDGVHLLNETERQALRRVQTWAIFRAALAGFVSSAIAAGAELLSQPLLGADPDNAGFWDLASFWGVVGAVTVVAAVLEIAFIYWDSLRSVHQLAGAAGLSLFDSEKEARQAVATALARAALELPNPSAEAFGVNPRRESSKAKLLAASLAYKAKIGVSNFLLKLLIRRVLSRAALRMLPFVGAPVTALWNALVAWKVLREARIRAMGPSAVAELLEKLFVGPALSPAGKAAALRAVASSIVRSEDLHPNLVALLLGVRNRLELGADEPDLDDSKKFVSSVGALPKHEQTVVLKLLAVAAIIDGKVSSREAKLIEEARAACGLPPNDELIPNLRKQFVAGHGVALS